MDEELIEAAEQIEELFDLHAWGQVDLGPRAQGLLRELLAHVEGELVGAEA